ncbi:MAG TPA: deoxyribonuclease IV [Syntrophorhabdaceae bacterium]|nr:deoxyribonuclease IV [Syntrophorhabdaceae bacterium]
MKIGFHMPISKGFARTFEQAKKLGCQVIQVFLKNPRSWEYKTWKDEEIDAFRKLHKEIMVFGHLSYLPNLAKIDEDERNLKAFVHEAGLCATLGLDGLVAHCGTRTDKTTGVNMIAESINRVHERHDLKILLENSSGQGTAIGKDADELALIYERVERKEMVFICIDTAHLFQSGCDIRVKKTWNAFLTGVEEKLGPHKIGVFHLNDSKTALASRIDRHWHIGKGQIGKGFFRSLINDKRFAHLGGVMETPKMGNMDEENMRVMRSYFLR